MGHTDSLVVADCGLSVPNGVECIDVSLAFGDPGFVHVLDSILADFGADRAIFAEEALEHNPTVAQRASRLALDAIRVEYVPHETLKNLTRHARAIIRTGEATPYANAILFSSVIFGSKT